MTAAPPGRRLYVGNLDFRMPVQMLGVLFAQHGVLEDVYLPQPKEGGAGASVNRGFGFVTFSTPEAAAAAKAALHDTVEPTFKRRLVVRDAKEREAKDGC